MPYAIVVLIKQVPDMNALRVDRASGQVQFIGQPVISSYDACALEAAIQMKDAHGGELTVISAGPASVKDALQRALGMGADRAIHVMLNDPNKTDALALSHMLADQIKAALFDIVFAGQASDDGGSGQVGPQVAELLGIPKIGSIASLSVEGNTITIERDCEDGRQTIDVQTPVLLMAQSGLNEPRYPSLKGMMAAKKKPLDVVLGSASSSDGLTWSAPYVPSRPSSGTIVQHASPAEVAAQFVDWLKERKLV